MLRLVVPASNSIAMFLGAAVAEVLRVTRPAIADGYVVPVASGLIAGESLAGIGIALALLAGMS